jgi:uncharacterized repeat protein (TIGR03803 family)
MSFPAGKSRRHGCAALLGTVLAAVMLAAVPVQAGVLTTLYDFCSKPNCADGSQPEAPLVEDQVGNLYGTTGEGGASNVGTVFALIHNKARTEWTETVLYNFCLPGCGQGAGPPSGGVVMGPSGELYGTTSDGGLNKRGSIFELSLDKSTNQWKERFYTISAAPSFAPTGPRPMA